MAFVLVLGEGVKGAFMKECEAAYLPFQPRVVNKIWKGCLYGCEGRCCQNDLNTIEY